MTEEKKTKDQTSINRIKRFEFCPNEKCSQLISLNVIDAKDLKANNGDIKESNRDVKDIKDNDTKDDNGDNVKNNKNKTVDKKKKDDKAIIKRQKKILVYQCSQCGFIKSLDENQCHVITV